MCINTTNILKLIDTKSNTFIDLFLNLLLIVQYSKYVTNYVNEISLNTTISFSFMIMRSSLTIRSMSVFSVNMNAINYSKHRKTKTLTHYKTNYNILTKKQKNYGLFK